MDYEVIIARGALRDIEHIRRYIARDNPERAQSFCQFLLGQAERLSRSPYQGMQIKDSAEGRFLVVKSYLLVYRVVEKKSHGTSAPILAWGQRPDANEFG